MSSAHDSAAEPLTIARLPGTEPIAGYRLIEPLGRGGFGEVWKCEAPGGLLKAIKFVQGHSASLDNDGSAEEELRAIQRIKLVRHPFILSMERVEVVENELIIVLELADQNLADVFLTERRANRPGIGRGHLLGYLREAAEALDVLHVQYRLQHLDIKPQNLFLVANHVKVGDFGLVQSLSGGDLSAGGPLAVTPRYAAPEVFRGHLCPNSDQYSLAIVYQELLTATFPFDGKNYRQLYFQHTQSAADVRALPESDQAIVARALSKNPEKRFPSCSDFIHALFFGQSELVSTRASTEPGNEWPLEPKSSEETLCGGHTVKTNAAAMRPVGEPHFRFGTNLPADVVRMRLDNFRHQWDATTIWADDELVLLHMKAPRSFWQRWTGWRPMLEVSLRVVSDESMAVGGREGVEVWLHISPRDCPADQGAELLGAVAPLLAESVRSNLQLNVHQRSQERLVWRYPLRLCEVQPDESLGTPIECQGKDISLGGIGFYVPGAVPAADVMLYLPKTPMTTQAYVRARIVRAQPCGDGWHEVGAILDVPCEAADVPPAEVTILPATEPGVPKPPSSRRLAHPRVWQAASVLAVACGVGIGAGVWTRPTAPAAGHVERTPDTLLAPAVVAPPVRHTPWVEVTGVAQPLDDLRDAIERAPDGGTIIVHGLHRCRPVRIQGKRLTLKAGTERGSGLSRLGGEEGRWEPLVSSDSELNLEGLELRGRLGDLAPLASVEGGALTLRECRLFMFAAGPAVTLRGGTRLDVEGGAIEAHTQALAIEPGESCHILVQRARIRVEEREGAAVLIWGDGASGAMNLVLTDTHIEAGRILACQGIAGPVRVTARGNRLTARVARTSAPPGCVEWPEAER